ncbi:hypothetical protein P4O66_006931 [Electrophorus voltai]|uniref:Protein sprouty homolog 1 n=1 Tax=Electrophorus voltai TaxID=2609070 RepID=A0AAD8ZGE1_9TELE|nr:hypothetical protein P4O66_006931 [Electrophorus voltai]
MGARRARTKPCAPIHLAFDSRRRRMDRGAHRGGVGSVVLIRDPATSDRPDLDLPAGAILSLEQIRTVRSCNEYTEGPAAPRRCAPVPAKRERTHEFGQRLVGAGPPGAVAALPPPARHCRAERPVRTQPKALGSPAQPLLLADALLKQAGANPLPAPPPPPLPPGPPAHQTGGKGRAWPYSPHRFLCERCGKCKCGECTAPRALPSRLACDGQCLCSAESLLEHGTCMCLVKGLFYHCSSQDDAGDSCADQPCSLSRGRCVPRFLCMGLLAPLFPCLLCYPPARACLRACQLCHDHLHRPGCRCKNSNTVYCRLQGWAGPQGKPS